MENGEWRMENGEGRMEKGEGRREKGEGRRENGEGRREIIKDGKVCVHQVTPRHIMPVSHLEDHEDFEEDRSR